MREENRRANKRIKCVTQKLHIQYLNEGKRWNAQKEYSKSISSFEKALEYSSSEETQTALVSSQNLLFEQKVLEVHKRSQQKILTAQKHAEQKVRESKFHADRFRIAQQLLSPLGFTWVKFPAGSYDMGTCHGTSRPLHRVMLKALQITQTTLTVAQ